MKKDIEMLEYFLIRFLTTKEKNALAIKINVEEGNKYYFGDIKFLGNTVYSDQSLGRLLGVQKERRIMVFFLKKELQINQNQMANLTNLYQNNGYLFSNINAVE
jgi:outer membrane protein insertion porin family